MAETWNKILLDNVIKDEDDMVSNSDTHIPTQQSVKAYVDNNAGGITGGWKRVSDTTTGSDAATITISNLSGYSRLRISFVNLRTTAPTYSTFILLYCRANNDSTVNKHGYVRFLTYNGGASFGYNSTRSERWYLSGSPMVAYSTDNMGSLMTMEFDVFSNTVKGSWELDSEIPEAQVGCMGSLVFNGNLSSLYFFLNRYNFKAGIRIIVDGVLA